MALGLSRLSEERARKCALTKHTTTTAMTTSFGTKPDQATAHSARQTAAMAFSAIVTCAHVARNLLAEFK